MSDKNYNEILFVKLSVRSEIVSTVHLIEFRIYIQLNAIHIPYSRRY